MYFISMSHPDLSSMRDPEKRTALEYAQRKIVRGKEVPPEALYCCNPQTVEERGRLKKAARDSVEDMRSASIRLTIADITLTEKSPLNAYLRQLEQSQEEINRLYREKWEGPPLRNLLQQNEQKQTLVHGAISQGNVKFFETMCNPTEMYHVIQDWGDPRLLGPDREPILHFALAQMVKASKSGNAETAQNIAKIFYHLIKECPGLITQKDKDGKVVAELLPQPCEGVFEDVHQYIEAAGRLKVEAELEKTKITGLRKPIQTIGKALDRVEAALNPKNPSLSPSSEEVKMNACMRGGCGGPC